MFGSKTKIAELEAEVSRLSELVETHKKAARDAQAELKGVYVTVKELHEQIDEYKAGIDSKAEQTQAVLFISDDLTTVTPVTRVNKNSINKMVEMQYLPWNKRNDEFAVNLAAMTIAHEALEQIIFSFEEELSESLNGEPDPKEFDGDHDA